MKLTREQLNTKLKTIKGEIVKPEVTFGDILVNCILNGEDRIEGKEKVKRFKLAMKLSNEEVDAVDLTLDELKEIKDTVGQYAPPLFVGQVWEVLDPEELK